MKWLVPFLKLTASLIGTIVDELEHLSIYQASIFAKLFPYVSTKRTILKINFFVTNCISEPMNQ